MLTCILQIIEITLKTITNVRGNRSNTYLGQQMSIAGMYGDETEEMQFSGTLYSLPAEQLCLTCSTAEEGYSVCFSLYIVAILICCPR